MSTDPADPAAAPSPDRPPTMEDIQAMTAAAQQAMAGITDTQAAVAAAVDGLKAEAANRSLTVPDEVIQSIAAATSAATIGELRRAGALRDDTDPPPPPDPAAGATPPADPPADPAATSKKNAAQRFLGL